MRYILTKKCHGACQLASLPARPCSTFSSIESAAALAAANRDSVKEHLVCIARPSTPRRLHQPSNTINFKISCCFFRFLLPMLALMLQEHDGVGGTSSGCTRPSVSITPGAFLSFWSHSVSRTSSKLMLTATAYDKWLSDGRTHAEQNETLKLSHNAGDKLGQTL